MSFLIIKLSLNTQNAVDCANLHLAIAADMSMNFFLCFHYGCDVPSVCQKLLDLL